MRQRGREREGERQTETETETETEPRLSLILFADLVPSSLNTHARTHICASGDRLTIPCGQESRDDVTKEIAAMNLRDKRTKRFK